jgi:hypothetical protein
MRLAPFLRALGCAGVCLASACASATTIRSAPPGASVFLDDQLVGKTPYEMSDTKIVGSSTRVRLVLKDYQQVETSLTRNEKFEIGPCIGGVFLLVPFLWVMGYDPEHLYSMTPMRAQPGGSVAATSGGGGSSATPTPRPRGAPKPVGERAPVSREGRGGERGRGAEGTGVGQPLDLPVPSL